MLTVAVFSSKMSKCSAHMMQPKFWTWNSSIQNPGEIKDYHNPLLIQTRSAKQHEMQALKGWHISNDLYYPRRNESLTDNIIIRLGREEIALSVCIFAVKNGRRSAARRT